MVAGSNVVAVALASVVALASAAALASAVALVALVYVAGGFSLVVVVALLYICFFLVFARWTFSSPSFCL